MAAEGVRFTDFYVSSAVCSASRSALLTGAYHERVGIRGAYGPNDRKGLNHAETTIAELLKARGYATGMAGKWHLGTRDEFHPTRQGFDRFFGFRDGSNQPIDPRLEVDGQVRQLKGCLPDLLVDEAVNFVDHNRERPFLLSIHFRAPHTPYGPVPEQDSAHYRDLWIG